MNGNPHVVWSQLHAPILCYFYGQLYQHQYLKSDISISSICMNIIYRQNCFLSTSTPLESKDEAKTTCFHTSNVSSALSNVLVDWSCSRNLTFAFIYLKSIMPHGQNVEIDLLHWEHTVWKVRAIEWCYTNWVNWCHIQTKCLKCL